jgi:predicted peptidase
MRSQTCLLSALSLLFFTSCTTRKSKPSGGPGALSAHTAKWRVSQAFEMRYLCCLPQDYDAKSGKTWPLMLFLHGAGERGTNLELVAVHGPPKLAKAGKNFPFIIIAPQCPEGQRWESEGLLQLLDHVTRQYAVDKSRVYLTGLSMGGYGTWSLGVTHPERFAAIAPICGGGQTIDALLAGNRAAALKTLGVWAFHGAKDSVVPVEESQRMVDALKKIGVRDVKLTAYPEAGHDSWTESYNNPELYEWLLAHRRGLPKPAKQ